MTDGTSRYRLQDVPVGNPTIDVALLRKMHTELDGCCWVCGPCFRKPGDPLRGPCEGFPCPTLLALEQNNHSKTQEGQ